MPDFAGHIELYDGDDPIFDGFGIEIEIDRALERKVWLKSGGYLIVDEMEALTAIDVNTGRFVGKSSLEDTITKTNMEAAREVAEQLRIRSIGGMIVVDFIDMDRPHNREKVTRSFNEYLRKDRSKAAVTRISELGLIEMSRKRTRESLLHTLTEPCTSCEGKGYTKSRTHGELRALPRAAAPGRSGRGGHRPRRGSSRRGAGAGDDRPAVSRRDGEAAAEADHRQGAWLVPRRGLRDPVAQRQGAHREVGDRRRGAGRRARTAARRQAAAPAAAAPRVRRPRSRRRWPKKRGASSIPSRWPRRGDDATTARRARAKRPRASARRPVRARRDAERASGRAPASDERVAGGHGPDLLRLPRKHLPVAHRGGGDAPPGEAGGAGRAIAVESAGTGDWHVGRAARSPQPGGGARRAGFRSRARPSSSRRPPSIATTTCWPWTAPTGDELLQAGARRRAIAPRCALLRSFDPAAPPDAEVPDPYYGGPRGFDEVFDICERGLPRAARAPAREPGVKRADARLDAALAAALGRRVGSQIARAHLAGGDINQRVRGRAGRRAPPVREDERALAARACSRRRRAGLAWLAEAGALRIPTWWRCPRADEPRVLVLELVATGAPARDFDEQLGRGLAALHRHGRARLRPRPRQLHRLGCRRRTRAAPTPAGRSSIGRAGWSRSSGLAADGGLRLVADAAGVRAAVRGAARRALRPGRAAGAPARRSVGRQPPLRRRGRALPHRPGGLRRSPGESIWR